MATSWCPRCGSDLLAPSAFSSDWRCSQHGSVLPLIVYQRVQPAELEHMRLGAEVPVWIPDPMPAGWTLAGLATVGDRRSRIRATVTAFRGPAPLGGEGEWLVIAEEPGIGLGASYARSADSQPLNPGTQGPPAKIHTQGHPTPLWAAVSATPDRSAYVGEAHGVWIWLVSFPADAGYAVLDDLVLTDVRQVSVASGFADLPVERRSERLRPEPPGP